MSIDCIKQRVKGGYLIARKCGDYDYPGIEIEFVSDTEDVDVDVVSRPAVLFEYPTCYGEDGRLRVLIWDDKYSEDYTREIEFET